MTRSIERLYQMMSKKEKSLHDQGVVLGTVITDDPVTIQLAGASIAKTLDYFVIPEGLKFKKDETVIAYKIRGSTSANKQFVLKQLDDIAMIGTYLGSIYQIDETLIKLPVDKVFCPWHITLGTKVYIIANRFPTPTRIWMVVNTWT